MVCISVLISLRARAGELIVLLWYKIRAARNQVPTDSLEAYSTLTPPYTAADSCTSMTTRR